MIRVHEFNSQWWGSPVGIIEDPRFFDLDSQSQAEVCAAYAWIQYSAPLSAAEVPEKLRQAGFNWVDVQVPFRINLSAVRSTPSTERLSVRSADEEPFEITRENLKTFKYERFRVLPGASAARINERYALWSNQLIANNPSSCLRILDGTAVQGWFLSESHTGKPLKLTLAMLKADSHISGLVLYQKAMKEFALRGAHIGEAAFSIANTPVLNIYSSLGARFLPPWGHWLRWS